MTIKHTISIALISLLSVPAIAGTQSDTVLTTDTICFSDGSVYMGQIADSLFNGTGKMIYADSTVYEGEWKDGLWEGEGELHYPDGDWYLGSFHEHEFSGYGVYHYNDGARYDGYWDYGMFNGAGTMEYADGSVYAGEWKNDMKDGLGVLYDNNAHALYKGEFRQDRFIEPDEYETDDYEPSYSYYASNRPDSCWYYPGDACIYITYGSGQKISVHADFYSSERFFAGFLIGFNAVNYRQSDKPSVIYDEETGQRIDLIAWDWYLNEIMTERTYTMFRSGGECGLSWGRFSVGTALGLGIQNTVRNCRSLEGNNSYYEAGTLYYRTKVTGVKFTYDLFTDFILKRNARGFSNDYFSIGNMYGSHPIFYSVNLRAGYSNVDGVFFGLGVCF